MISRTLEWFNLIKIFTIWRFALFIPLIIAAFLIKQNITSDFTYIYNPLTWSFSFHTAVLFPWANFDGIHYINIAQYNYINQARFFPLFPLLVSILSIPTSIIISSPLTQFYISFLLVNFIFFIALWIFKKLIEIDFSSQIANKSLFYLLLFPTAFFFVSIYSEGLFLLLVLLSFYFARKNKWLFSIICAALLMTTRFVGIAILPALFYEFIKTQGLKTKKIALFLIAPLGLFFYSLFNYYKWGNYLYFIQAQGELGNNRTVSTIILFPQTIFRYFKMLTTVPVISLEWGIALLELSSFVLAVYLLYFAWKKKIRTSYLIFALINFAVTVSTGTFSALPRYLLTIFPIFMAVALIENKVFKIIYFLISPILLFILLMLFSRGYFVS